MFWRGVLGYLPVNIVQGLVGLLTIVTFTRLLTPGQFGDYALGFSVMALTHTTVFTWNEAALARFWAGESGREDGGAHHAATIYRTWLLLLAVLPAAGLLAALWPMSPSLKLAVLAGLAAVLPRTFAKLAQERRRAAGEVGGSAMIDLVQTLGGFLIGALEVVLPGYIFLGFAIGAILTGILLGLGVLGPAGPSTLLLVFALASLAVWAVLRFGLGMHKGQVKIWHRDIND